MAADMTDETIAQNMERIEKMSIKEIQKEIEFLESPGYNCEGLVCADGVIVPRTRMLRKVLWEKKTSQKSPDSSPMGKRRICCQSGCNRNRVEKQFSQFQSYIYILCIRRSS